MDTYFCGKYEKPTKCSHSSGTNAHKMNTTGGKKTNTVYIDTHSISGGHTTVNP